MRQVYCFKVLTGLIVLFLVFSINAEVIEEKSSRGTPACSPLLLSSVGIGENLMMSVGLPGCLVDIYTTDQCTSPTNVGAVANMTYLGTFTLDSNGEINTGITTMSMCYVAYPSTTTMTPIGSIYIPVDQSFIPFMTEAVLESSLPISVQYDGIEGTIIYDGTTYSGLPEGPFNLPNINGNVTNVTTRTTGFDGTGAQLVNEQIHPIDFVSATCTTSQDPDSTSSPVDVGTVITLEMSSLGAIDASIGNNQMTVSSGSPGVDNNIIWSATHTATQDTTIVGTATNPNGEEMTCSWNIDINCIESAFVSVADVGDVGVVISGTQGCLYDVRVNDLLNGGSTDYTVNIDSSGTGTLNLLIPANTLLEVGFQGFPYVSDSFMTNSYPTASAVNIIDANGGDFVVGDVLMGDYTYEDIDNDAEGASTFRWLRNNVEIPNATNINYTLIDDDAMNTIQFEVRPASLTGASPGSVYLSPGGTVGCADASFIFVPAVGESGIEISGTPNCRYGIRFTPINSPNPDADLFIVTIGIDGTATLDGEIVPLNTLIEVGAFANSVLGEITDSELSNAYPIANEVSIMDSNGGDFIVGDVLLGSYTYFDNEDDIEGISTFRWLRDDLPIANATSLNYTLVSADSGTNIKFEVVPVAKTGKLSSGNSFESPSTLVTNSPPVASSVNVTGTFEVGNTLTGNYTYNDVDNDPEGISIYQWYRNGLAISGATEITYLISSADSGKTLTFEVTPISAHGSNAASGIPVSSAGVVIGVLAIPTLSSRFILVLLVLVGWIGFRQFKYQV